MSEDTLNDKFWDAIDNNINSYSHISGRAEAANECEKICIQSQIDLLNKYIPIVDAEEKRTNGFICTPKMMCEVIDLTNKLNELAIKNNK